MADICRMTVKMPKVRIRMMTLLIPTFAVFFKKPQTQERICQAAVDWTVRGMRFYVDGKSV